jgi:hypothetical protein
VLIIAALPNPAAADAGNESVTLLNTGAGTVALDAWKLTDAAGGHQVLSGEIPAGGVVRVTLGSSLQLGNRGDSIELVDVHGSVADRVSYGLSQVRDGRTIAFGR